MHVLSISTLMLAQGKVSLFPTKWNGHNFMCTTPIYLHHYTECIDVSKRMKCCVFGAFDHVLSVHWHSRTSLRMSIAGGLSFSKPSEIAKKKNSGHLYNMPFTLENVRLGKKIFYKKC